MKAKDYWKQKEQEKQIDPTRGQPIICPACGNIVGYTNDYMFMVIPEPGIICPQCDEIVVWSNQVSYSSLPPFQHQTPYTGDPIKPPYEAGDRPDLEPKVTCFTEKQDSNLNSEDWLVIG